MSIFYLPFHMLLLYRFVGVLRGMPSFGEISTKKQQHTNRKQSDFVQYFIKKDAMNTLSLLLSTSLPVSQLQFLSVFPPPFFSAPLKGWRPIFFSAGALGGRLVCLKVEPTGTQYTKRFKINLTLLKLTFFTSGKIY